MSFVPKAGSSPVPAPSAEAPVGPAATAVKKATGAADLDSYASVSGAKAPEPAAPAVLTGGIRTQLPVDLGTIETHGRWATGFALDGGSVRLMWVNARRVNDPSNKRGFELSFFLQGPAIGKLRDRMQQKGAQSSPFPFYAGELAEGAAHGKSTLMRSGQSWSPQGQSLFIHLEDKYTVHLVDHQPEALKGAVRIRVYGDDAASNASLSEVVSKLGLQHIFAPPTGTTLERFKLTRFLWAHQPEKLESALWAGFSELDAAALGKKLEELDLGADHPSWKALDQIDLEDEKLKKRLKLGLLLWSKSPKGFADWAKSDSYSVNGLFPNTYGGSEYNLTTALATAGVAQDSPEFKAALEAPTPSAEVARKFFEVGLLLKNRPAAAEQLLLRSIDEVPVAKLRAIAESSGIDLSGDRLEKLEYREVYPGYFTAYDPSLPDRLKEKGARYLYSTLDNPERVFDVITGGQKASFTRFQEGKLVQGKSSSADFGTGGAFSVFTRLVTESAIEQAKKQKQGGSSYGYGYNTSFNNWGGSRPYKAILNRKILGRLDWYGYNGDNYGRSTGLKAANHGEAIIETINKSYSGSNEIMFAVGNATSFIDFIVCENEQQKSSLLSYLKERGIDSVNGKPIAQLVRIETSFFEHPDDLTVEAALKEALQSMQLQSAELATRSVAGPFAKQNAQAKTKAAAEQVAGEVLPEVVKGIVRSTAQWEANNQAAQIVPNALSQIPIDQIEAAALEAAKSTAANASLEPPANLSSNARWTVQNQLQYVAQNKGAEAVNAKAPEIAKAAAEAAKAAQPAGADPTVVSSAVRNAVYNAIMSQGKEIAALAVKAQLAEEALKAAEQAIRSSAQSSARWAMQAPVTDAALSAAKAKAESIGAASSIIQKVRETASEGIRAKCDGSVKSQLTNNLKSRLYQMTKPRAEQLMGEALGDAASKAAREAAKAEIDQTIQNVIQKFNAEHPDKKVDPSGPEVAKLKELGDRRADEVAKWFSGAEIGTSIDPILSQIVEGTASEKASGDQGAIISEIVDELVVGSAEAQLQNQLRSKVSAHVSKILDDVAKERSEAWVKSAAPGLAKEVLENVANQLSTYTWSNLAHQLANEHSKIG
jgi:hypothetical protein